MPSPKVATVLGSGSWGTALASVLTHHFDRIWLWGRDPAVVDSLAKKHENSHYLPGLRLPKSIVGHTDPKVALEKTSLVVVSLPVKALRDVLTDLRPLIPPDVPVVSTSKGIDIQTLELPSQIIQKALGRKDRKKIFTLSGPSFARETVEKRPTAVTIAGEDVKGAEDVGKLFFTPWFRTYPSNDQMGVEVAGAAKNVMAIAAGIVQGLQLGSNGLSALITRGLAEITRLGLQRGADPATFQGLAGMGDLVLTCTGQLSRNRTLGEHLAKGKSLEDSVKALGQVAEGVPTTKAIHKIARQDSIDMPICDEMYAILFEGKDPSKALADLMSRPMRHEKH